MERVEGAEDCNILRDDGGKGQLDAVDSQQSTSLLWPVQIDYRWLYVSMSINTSR